MNILVFSWRDIRHPFEGGAERVMYEHMKGWVAAGHEVTHFSSRIVRYSKSEETIDGIKFIRCSFQLLGVNIAGFFWYIFGKHPKFDLVVEEFHGIPFFTTFYVRAKKLAVLQEVAREVWFKNHLPFPLNWLLGFLGYLGEPFIFLFYKKIPFMVGSASAKDDLIKMGVPGENITIVPHGVLIPKNLSKFPKEKTKTVMFLGALAKDKGIEDALKTFSILAKNGFYNFWVVGQAGAGYQSKLNKLVKEIGVEVKFWGFVSEEKKFELLSRAHVMLNPSIREGWGLVNIEANAMGTPVIAYKSPGLVDSVKDGVSGIICKKNSPEEMAKETTTLLSDVTRYERLSESAILRSKNFSWPNSRQQSLKLINYITGRSKNL